MLPQQEQQQQQQQQQQEQQDPHQQALALSHQAEQAATRYLNNQQGDAATAAYSGCGVPSTAAHAAHTSATVQVENAAAEQLASNGSGEYEDAGDDEDEYEEEDEDGGSEGGSQGSLPLMQQAWKPDYTFKVSCCTADTNSTCLHLFALVCMPFVGCMAADHAYCKHVPR
jgi:hypothetical protein